MDNYAFNVHYNVLNRLSGVLAYIIIIQPPELYCCSVDYKIRGGVRYHDRIKMILSLLQYIVVIVYTV